MVFLEKGTSAEDCWIFITICLMFPCDAWKQFDMRLAVCNLALLHELLQCSSVCFLFCFVFLLIYQVFSGVDLYIYFLLIILHTDYHKENAWKCCRMFMVK